MTDLTPMQAACWSGRQSGAVAAHLYVELDGAGLDSMCLAGAVARLFRRHPMLRMRVTPGGRQVVLPFDPARHALAVDDLSQIAPDTALAATRQRMTHQALDLADGQACELRLSLLPEGRHRLHVDLDMIAADPSCFGRLMEDLALFYRDPQADCAHLQPCYLDLLPPPRADAADRAWWRERLADLSAALHLPVPSTPSDIWDDTPALFADFTRAQAATGPGGDHLAYWTDCLRGAPARRPFTADSLARPHEATTASDGGWCLHRDSCARACRGLWGCVGLPRH